MNQKQVLMAVLMTQFGTDIRQLKCFHKRNQPFSVVCL